MSENKTSVTGKEQWGSNFGFLMAAVGSAVGLGNIWGFPYKMGVGGGFAFLLLYLLLALFVGFIIMLGELMIGRHTGKGVMAAYRTLSTKYTFLGWMGFLCPFLILSFYCSLGGFCIKYAVANIGDLFHASWGVNGQESSDFFMALVNSPGQSIFFGLLFVVLTAIIVMGGINGGIEKFTTIAMPALFIMLAIVMIRSMTLPGAGAGIAFILKPNFEVFAGTGWISVMALAGGQMFFSLSLGMGCMITYGSYLSKKESLERNAVIIPICDTTVAVMAAFAVMPAVFAMGMEPTAGPGLLFMSLQTVFQNMGVAGPFFGFLFYFLVFIAAITSSISLLEVATAVVMDMQEAKGKKPNRKAIAATLAAIVCLGTIIVSVDALGGGPLPQPLGFCWLDFFDLLSEGIMMPLGALCMSLIIGWKLGPVWIENELTVQGNHWKTKGFAMICFKFVAPAGMILVLLGQIDSFFKLNWF